MSKKKSRTRLQNPCNREISEDHRKAAAEVMADMGKVAIRYVRSNPTAKWCRDDKDRPELRVDKGFISGCLVAFEHGGDILIGWSGRCTSTEDATPAKRSAIHTAVLRALSDGVQATPGKVHYSTKTQNVIPGRINRELPSFLTRVQKYFHRVPDNYIRPLTKSMGG